MKKSRGFTLTEILISLVVVSVGLLALSTLALVGVNEFQYNKGKIEAMNESMRLNMLLTQYFGQAVKVWNAAPPTAGTTGGISTFNYNTMASAPADLTLVASFKRDVGGRSVSGANNPDANGDYVDSAMWWRRPTATTSGVLFFYGGTGTNAPSYSNPFVSRLTELQFATEFPPGGRFSAVNVRAVLRYARPTANRVWCPRADIAATASCNSMAGYVVDLEKRFRIVLRNNVINTGAASATGAEPFERPLGLIYFFNPALPTGWSN